MILEYSAALPRKSVVTVGSCHANLNSVAMQEGYNVFQRVAVIHQYLVSPLWKFAVIPMVPYTGLNFVAREERKEGYAAGLS